MDEIDETPSYIARCECGCGAIVMATVDTPERANEVAQEVAECIRAGCAVQRVTVSQVREMVKDQGFGCRNKPKQLGLI